MSVAQLGKSGGNAEVDVRGERHIRGVARGFLMPMCNVSANRRLGAPMG